MQTRVGVAVAIAASGLALMGIGAASAHNATLNGSSVCSSTTGDRVITWTVTNDYNLTATIGVTVGTVDSPFPGLPVGSSGNLSSVKTTTTIPGSTTSYPFKIHVLWSDNFQQDVPTPGPLTLTFPPCAPLPSNLTILKTADASPVSVGDPVGFGVVVHNTGLGAANAVTVTDPLPTLTGVTWTTATPGCTIAGVTMTCLLGTMAPGASKTIHVGSATTTTAGTLPNTATVSATGVPPIHSSATIVIDPASLSVVKTADASPVNAGDPVGFTVVVSNGGPGTAKAVTVNDPLPALTGVTWTTTTPSCAIAAGTLTCAFGDMASGDSKTIHLTSPTTVGGTLPNTATASASNTGSAHGTATILINAPKLVIDKTADATPVNSGDPIGFAIVVTNAGSGLAKAVKVTDPLPSLPGVSWTVTTSGCAITAGTMTCTLGDMAPAATKSIHLTSATTGATSGNLPNTATASATNAPSVDSAAAILVNGAALMVTKTADASPVSSGDPIGFKIVVHNTGAGTAKAVSVSDPLPTLPGVSWKVDPGPTCAITAGTLNCALGDMATLASATIHLSGTTTAATAGTLPNTVTASATNTNTASSTATLVVNGAGLTVKKTADASPVSSGDPIGFKVVVGNSGLGTAHGVTLSDPLPTLPGVSWTVDPGPTCAITTGTLACTLGDIAPGVTKTIHVSSATTALTAGTLPNTATAAATNGPPVTDSATIVVNHAVLAITKTADAHSVSSGDTVGFTIVVSNGGPGTARAVTVNDPLPALTGVLWSIDVNPGCTITTGTLSCTFGDLASAGTKTIHVTSATTAATSGTLANTATTSATNTASAHASDSIVVNHAGLAIVKTADAKAVTSGDPVGFKIVVSNAGPGVARAVTVDDPLPTLTGVSWTVATTGCAITTGTLSCTFGDLAAGGTTSIHITSATTSATSGTLDNTATASARNAPSVTSNDSIVVTPPPPSVFLTPGLAIAKIGPATTSTGGVLPYVVTVTSNGDAPANNVVLTDTTPAHTTFVSETQLSGPTFSCTNPVPGTVGTTSCVLATMPVGAVAVFSIVNKADADLTNVSVLTNTATAIATGVPIVSANAATSVQPNTPVSPQLNIQKTGPATVTAGTTITYTVVVTNLGTGAATGVAMSDSTPANTTFVSETQAAGPPFTCSAPASGATGTLTCTIPTLDAGASGVFTIVDTVAAATANDVVLTNTATVVSNNGPPASATAKTTVKVPTTVKGVTLTRPPTAVLPTAPLPNTGSPTRRLAELGLLMLELGALAMLLGYWPKVQFRTRRP